jgi:hypothetical protein
MARRRRARDRRWTKPQWLGLSFLRRREDRARDVYRMRPVGMSSVIHGRVPSLVSITPSSSQVLASSTTAVARDSDSMRALIITMRTDLGRFD